MKRQYLRFGYSERKNLQGRRLNKLKEPQVKNLRFFYTCFSNKSKKIFHTQFPHAEDRRYRLLESKTHKKTLNN